jgi:hypothetical protein
MSAVKLTIFDNVSTFESLRPFHPFNDSDGLPFPLYINGYWKALISTVLLCTLIEGTRLRIVILSYLSSPDTKLGSVNYLIWIDQINGFFLGYTIVARIMFIVSPYPVSDLLGFDFCKLNVFFISVYLSASNVWSCFIAIFRVVFIKAQNWLSTQIGEINLLKIMIGFGSFSMQQYFPALRMKGPFFNSAHISQMLTWT